MNQLIDRIALGVGVFAFATSAAAFDAPTTQLRNKSRWGKEILNIQAAPSADLETVQVTFNHQEKTPNCSFEIHFVAKRIPHNVNSDDYNMALPDGSYVKYAQFKVVDDTVKSLEIDQSSKNPRYASIVVKLPASYDSRRCRVKDAELEVLFFR